MGLWFYDRRFFEERQTVCIARTMFFDRRAVGIRTVTLMDLKTVTRKFFREARHQAIAIHFRNNGSYFYCGYLLVSLDNRSCALRLAAVAQKKAAIQKDTAFCRGKTGASADGHGCPAKPQKSSFCGRIRGF